MASSSAPDDRGSALPWWIISRHSPHQLPLPWSPGFSIPNIVSGIFQVVSENTVSTWNQIRASGERKAGLHLLPQRDRQLIITYLPSRNLSFTWSQLQEPIGATTGLVTSRFSTSDAEDLDKDETSDPSVASSTDEPAAAASSASSTGPAFIGQVFTMCDAARRGLIAVRPMDSAKSRKLPYLPSFITSKLPDWIDRDFGSKSDDTEGPVFRFYFDRNDAAAYVKHLGLSGSMVGSCPLDAAYRYYKGKPPMFKFMADREQVKVAKQLLRKDQGRTVARKFRGVPVFTARNLTIAMSTPTGIRWFTPYFFDKSHLDKLIGHSVDNYYQMLIHARRSHRHSQIADDFPAEPPEDDTDGLMDPPEVQEFMEEIGQGGNPFLESALMKTVEIQFQDMVDNVILGNKLSRQIAGLQPTFPVLVDSFEKRAAAAEMDADGRSNSNMSTSQLRSNKEDGSYPTNFRESNESGRTSPRDSAEAVPRKNDRETRAPFQLFGRNWGFQFQGLQKRKGSQMGSSSDLENEEAEELRSKITETNQSQSMQKDDPVERIQPKLTMMGIAMTEPETNMNDAVLQRAMAEAAKDIENRVRKGEGTGQDHGPLFIADLGGPPEIWGRESSTFSGWDSDDNE